MGRKSIIAIALFLLRLGITSGEVIHVILSAKYLCPAKPCVDLSHFAANSSEYIHANTTTLIFQPGSYALKTNLVI